MRPQKLDPFYAIGDPNRREILQLLSKNSLTVNSIADNFEMSRPAVSKHIKILYESGFVSIEDIGRERYCILRKEGFSELQEWIDYFDNFWKVKFSKLEALLDKKAANKQNFK
jgi:DNA-binding transcriptional ArsR family regulator